MALEKIIKLSKKPSDVRRLVDLLLAGEVIAAPTETAYGLLALATDSTSLSRVYKIKGREIGKPCPVIISSLVTARKYFYFTKSELVLAKKFWPGPLTIILKPKKNNWPKSVINQQGKVGVRVPGSIWLRRLLLVVNKPLTATSANIAGQPTLFSYQSVVTALQSRDLKFLVTSPKLKLKKTSTVIELVKNKLIICRLGAISEKKIRRSLV